MPGRPPRERPLRPVLYSPASRGKLPSPSGEGCSENLSVHPSTKAGQLQIFPRFGYHSQVELYTRMVAALETLDSRRTLRFLLTKIRRVERLSDELGFGRSWRLMRLETEGQPYRDDMVAVLVARAGELAHRLAAKGSEEAEWVMENIDSHSGEFFSRIHYLVLARVGNHLQGRLDQVLQSEEARNPGFHASTLPRYFARSSGTHPMGRETITRRRSTGVAAAPYPDILPR